MRREIYKVLLLAILTISSFLLTLNAATLTLKSARAVTAEVLENVKEQSVQVSILFIPVRSLDELNNKRMNSVVSRFLAEQALSQFYGKEKSVNFNRLKHAVFKKTIKQKAKYTYIIPYSAISDAVVIKVTDKKKLSTKYSRFLNDDIFLSASEIFSRDLKLAEAYFLKRLQENKKGLAKSINVALDALKEKVENQDDLLSAEKNDFFEKIEKVRKYLLKKINLNFPQTTMNASTKSLATFVSNYVFNPDFEEIFVNDKILLKFGGCRAFKLKDGKIALIGVGISEVKNKSAKDRLVMHKIAEQRAFAALAEHESVNVTSFSQLFDSATITIVNKKETAKDQRTISTMSSIRAEAYFTNMETVGYWYSKDGKLFFLAKGCFISKDK